MKEYMKYLARIIIIITIFTVGFFIGAKYSEEPALLLSEEVNEQEVNTLSLMVDFGNGRIETYNNIEIGNITNVFELLEEVTSNNNIELKYTDSEMGVFIEAIDGVANNFANNQYWQYFVNNNYAKIGASNFSLTGGEIVEWKYLKEQF